MEQLSLPVEHMLLIGLSISSIYEYGLYKPRIHN